MRTLLVTVLALLLAPTLAYADAPAAQVRALIGGPARLAWTRDAKKLILLDTEDPNGEVEKAFDFPINRPIITPDGQQVLLIAFDQWATLIMNWDGTGLRKLVDARVTCVRADEKGIPWIYYQTKDNEFRTAPLAQPDKSEVVWKLSVKPRDGKTENFQTSADGKVAGSNCPWPAIGIAKLPQAPGADFSVVGSGCWPQIARDNSYRMFHCTDGSHTRLEMYDLATRKAWRFPINPNPKRGGAECPRWANDTRFVICTDRPARQTGVYVGKFNPDFTALGEWVTLSTKGSNAEAEIWIKSAAKWPGPATVADVTVSPTPKTVVANNNPRNPAPPRAPLKWPASNDALLFVWENGAAENTITAPDGKTTRRSIASPRGGARPGYFGSFDVQGGALEAEGVEKELLAAVKASGGLTIQATLNPEKVGPGIKSAIVSYALAEDGSCDFSLEQNDDKLVFRSGAASCNLLTLGAGRIHHLIITLNANKVTCYISGKESASATINVAPKLWKEGRLLFGDLRAPGWEGQVEGIAIFGRGLSAQEAAAEYAAYRPRLANRYYPKKIVVTAKLLELTPVPDARAIAPYTRSMVGALYEIQSIESGKCDAKRVQVAHWAILDSKPLESAPKEVGKTYTLSLELMKDHAQLERERFDSDVTDLDAPVFVESLR